MRISDWSSDVCSSDLIEIVDRAAADEAFQPFVEDAGLEQPCRPEIMFVAEIELLREIRPQHRIAAAAARLVYSPTDIRDRKSTRLHSSHQCASRMPSSDCTKTSD